MNFALCKIFVKCHIIILVLLRHSKFVNKYMQKKGKIIYMYKILGIYKKCEFKYIIAKNYKT